MCLPDPFHVSFIFLDGISDFVWMLVLPDKPCCGGCLLCTSDCGASALLVNPVQTYSCLRACLVLFTPGFLRPYPLGYFGRLPLQLSCPWDMTLLGSHGAFLRSEAAEAPCAPLRVWYVDLLDPFCPFCRLWTESCVPVVCGSTGPSGRWALPL